MINNFINKILDIITQISKDTSSGYHLPTPGGFPWWVTYHDSRTRKIILFFITLSLQSTVATNWKANLFLITHQKDPQHGSHLRCIPRREMWNTCALQPTLIASRWPMFPILSTIVKGLINLGLNFPCIQNLTTPFIHENFRNTLSPTLNSNSFGDDMRISFTYPM